MVSTNNDWPRCISDPRSIVKDICEKKLEQAHSEAGIIDAKIMCEAIEARFKQTFTEPKLKRKIPLLNATKDVRLVKEGTLVRFRCMVQDPNFGHELNMFLVKARNTLNEEERILVNLYSDAGYDVVEPWCISTDPLEGGGHGQFTEVEILYCIGIPGEAPWVCEGDTEIPEYLDEKGPDGNVNPVAYIDTKRPKYGDSRIGSMVKFVNSSLAPKTARAVEVVGIFGWGHSPHSEGTVVPCIHAILCEPIDLVGTLNLAAPSMEEIPDLRERCHEYLAGLVGGDKLVASLLLLHLLSSTLIVKEAKVGKLGINIFNFPAVGADAADRLVKGISDIVPWCTAVPLSISALNNTNFQPNAEQGDLAAGALQLAPLTVLVCDETRLEEGTLQEKGLRNLQALQRVVLDQQLGYQFPYQTVDINTDLRVIVLSAGKSLLRLDVVAPLSSEAAERVRETTPDNPDRIPQQQLWKFRAYLLHCQALEYSIPSEVSEAISEDYAESRRRAQTEEGEQKMLTQEDLSFMLTLARLISVSKGQTKLQLETWDEVKDLFSRLREREAEYKRQGTTAGTQD